MTSDKVFGCIGGMVAAGIILIVTILIDAYVLIALWDWFIVTKFGVSSLLVKEAIGLSLVVSFFLKECKKEGDSDNKDKTEKWIGVFSRAVAVPLVFLLFGYLIHRFV